MKKKKSQSHAKVITWEIRICYCIHLVLKKIMFSAGFQIHFTFTFITLLSHNLFYKKMQFFYSQLSDEEW